ncbi:thioester reductase domain-containing protein [Rhodococcus qingshengii]|uniref:Thioester reductase domain-containing protein n=1 Tax=Rhodococcus qingshengii TaxID=334542 RepID=A0AAW6LM45_RHOSG|nr:thioester reductase domain-containing protein [Rhodococcus qingshengii]MDE8647604.1 thioester reductase domain-containing protein [Rhodococcus qingshengii]
MGRPNGSTLAEQGPSRRRRTDMIESGSAAAGVSIADLLDSAGGIPTGGGAGKPSAAGDWDVDRLSATITAVANRFLPAPIDSNTDFFDGGASSVAAVELVSALASEHAVQLDLDDLFADARPRQLATRWLAARGVSTPTITPAIAPVPVNPTDNGVVDVDETLAQLMADVARADSLPFVGPPHAVAPRRILLTGVTGFLGSHMLLDLLRHSDAHIVCLIRAADADAGATRLADALSRFHLPWSPEVARRVTVLPGDFRLPRLGLSEDRWEMLADDVDSIVNVGAAVDFLRGYSSLRQSNVVGPLTLAELAMTGRVKPLHHISSVAVFNEIGIASMAEDDQLAHINKLAAGYDKTKWAAEVALRRAREHGLVVTIMRPAGIGGHPETGAHNSHDFSSAFVATHSHFGTMPAFRYLNVAGVDWVSRTAAAIACEPSAWGSTYHLTGVPRSLDDAVRDMSIAGMAPRLQHWEDWRTDTLDRIRTGPVPELEFLARMLQSPTTAKLCEAQLSAPAARCDRTLAFLAEHDLPAPTVYDGAAQKRTFERLAEVGLARLPQLGGTPYVWFSETLEGAVGSSGDTPDIPCSLALRLSIESMYQLVTDRRVDVTGELTCFAIHPSPLTVEKGDMWIRPQDGVPLRNGLDHPLMRYRLELRDVDGGRWWFEGTKTARAQRNLVTQTRTLAVQIGRPGELAHLRGEVAVPIDTYLPDQVDGLHADPALSARDQRKAKLIWFGWFQLQIGRGLAEPSLRAAMELFDLRRGATYKGLRR